jgi:oligosaccharide translocation protein RFT1
LLYYKVYGGSADVYVGWGYWLGALIELLIEPCAVYVQKNLLYSIKATAEGSSLLIKCIATIYLFPDQSKTIDGITDGIRAYGLAEVIAALWLFASYIFLVSRHLKDQDLYKFWMSMIPKRSPLTGRFFDPYFTSVAISFWVQSILKHILTVGDKILMISLEIPNQERGIYRQVSDLGSLIARLFFQPLEEICRNYFSKELTGNITKKTLKTTKTLLVLLLKFHLLFGSFFVFFAPFYTKLLLETLYNSEKATDEAAFVLGVYCLYIPFMGVNGITEAFLQGVGDSKIIQKQSVYLLVFWLLFTFTFYICYPLFGISGLILANIVNLLCRILFSYFYSSSFYKSPYFSEILPRPLVFLAFVVSSLLLKSLSLSHTEHLILGISLGISTLAIIFLLESSFKSLLLFKKSE